MTRESPRARSNLPAVSRHHPHTSRPAPSPPSHVSHTVHQGPDRWSRQALTNFLKPGLLGRRAPTTIRSTSPKLWGFPSPSRLLPRSRKVTGNPTSGMLRNQYMGFCGAEPPQQPSRATPVLDRDRDVGRSGLPVPAQQRLCPPVVNAATEGGFRGPRWAVRSRPSNRLALYGQLTRGVCVEIRNSATLRKVRSGQRRGPKSIPLSRHRWVAHRPGVI